MRLTCPNCGAQYEVPDEVIPSEGRDVQCSNCGNTWFQAHPDAVATDVTEPDPVIEAPTPEADPEPTPEPEAPQEEHRGMDPEFSDILREEADREARLRAAESGSLESQPDLGLESTPDDEESRRTREATNRMARIRGEDPKPAAPTDTGSRRGLLPDIEEINSSLRSSGDGTRNTELGPLREQPAQPEPKKGGFMRGFALVLIVAVLLVLVYSNSKEIATAVPQADPMLSAFVAMVDQARVWLDSQAAALLAPSE